MIIGLGTGRCGTMSLARLFGSQPGLTVTHERFGASVPWGSGGERYCQRLIASGQQELSGDVAFVWLPHAETFLAAGARMICLQREREATIDSYLRKTQEDLSPARNHWQRCGPSHAWDRCYPTTAGEDASKREAISAYYDLYYRRAWQLARRHEHFYLFPTDALNEAASQRRILAAAKISEGRMRLRVGIRENRGKQHEIPSELHSR